MSGGDSRVPVTGEKEVIALLDEHKVRYKMLVGCYIKQGHKTLPCVSVYGMSHLEDRTRYKLYNLQKELGILIRLGEFSYQKRLTVKKEPAKVAK